MVVVMMMMMVLMTIMTTTIISIAADKVADLLEERGLKNSEMQRFTD
jgi:hypothetical protein